MVLTLIRLFITYQKTHPVTKQVYIGKASGLVSEVNEDSAEQVLQRRENAPHHKNKEGFKRGVIDEYSTDEADIRGREQMMVDYLKKQGICANKLNPISSRNKKRMKYLEAALALFGDVLIMLIVCQLV